MKAQLNLPVLGGVLLLSGIIVVAATHYYAEDEKPRPSVLAQEEPPNPQAVEAAAPEPTEAKPRTASLETSLDALQEEVAAIPPVAASDGSQDDSLERRISAVERQLQRRGIDGPAASTDYPSAQQQRIAALKAQLLQLQNQ